MEQRTWWDRDLSIGGRVLYEDSQGSVHVTNIKSPHPIGRIPTLAPHFGAPALGPFNLETHMTPIIGLDSTSQEDGTKSEGASLGVHSVELLAFIQKLVPEKAKILNFDLELYDSQPPQLGGLKKDLLFCPRFDDKACSWAAFAALCSTCSDDTFLKDSSSIYVAAAFDNEEIGSRTRQGAMSSYMETILSRVVESVCKTALHSTPQGFVDISVAEYSINLMSAIYARSVLISSDVSHAVNPNVSASI